MCRVASSSSWRALDGGSRSWFGALKLWYVGVGIALEETWRPMRWKDLGVSSFESLKWFMVFSQLESFEVLDGRDYERYTNGNQTIRESLIMFEQPDLEESGSSR
jgi:hypothetical protein